MRLQRQEILVRLEVRIVFADREQSPEGAAKRILRVLHLLDFRRVGQVVGVEMDRGRLGARLGDLREHVLFLFGVALNGGDEIGDEVGAALVLVLDFRPCRLGGLLLGRDDIVAAGGNGDADQGQHGQRSQPLKYAH